MTKKLLKYDIFGFIFVSVAGTLAHFVYEWSGENIAAALFCPINECPWEHLKLIYFPYIIWAFISAFALREKNVLPAKIIGVTAGMIFILAFYYTCTGITGRNIDILNIISFFLGIFLSFAADYVIIKSGKLNNTACMVISVILIAVVGTLFILFTFAPPLIPLFKDPITSTYGI